MFQFVHLQKHSTAAKSNLYWKLINLYKILQLLDTSDLQSIGFFGGPTAADAAVTTNEIQVPSYGPNPHLRWYDFARIKICISDMMIEMSVIY